MKTCKRSEQKASGEVTSFRKILEVIRVLFPIAAKGFPFSIRWMRQKPCWIH